MVAYNVLMSHVCTVWSGMLAILDYDMIDG